MRDNFEILGISNNSSLSQVKNQYRKLVKKFHPDASRVQSEEQFCEIAKAYREIVSSFFFDGRSFAIPKIGTDIKKEVPLDIEEYFSKEDFEFSVNYSRDVECRNCCGYGCEDFSKMKKCAFCKGSGKHISPIPNLDLNGNYLDCSYCNGHGAIIGEDNKCSSCGGRGKIPRNEFAFLSVKKSELFSDKVMDFAGNYGANGGTYGDLKIKIQICGNDKYRKVNDNTIETDLLLSSNWFLCSKKRNVKLSLPSGKEIEVAIPKDLSPGDLYALPEKIDGGAGVFWNFRTFLKVFLPKVENKEYYELAKKMFEIEEKK
jgi:molecular chaperone DnaJ